jgi:hypothetical protein
VLRHYAVKLPFFVITLNIRAFLSLVVIFAFLLLEFRNVLEPSRHFTLRVGSIVHDADIRDGFIDLSSEYHHSAIGIVMLQSDAINVFQKYSIYDVVCSSMMHLLCTVI